MCDSKSQFGTAPSVIPVSGLFVEIYANVCQYVRSFVFVGGLSLGLGFASPSSLCAFQVEEPEPPVVTIEDCKEECWRKYLETLADIDFEYDRLREDIECRYANEKWRLEQEIEGYQNDPNLSAADRERLIRDAQATLAQLRVDEARELLEIERARGEAIRLAAEELDRCRAGCNVNPVLAPEPIPDPIP